ncbi:hypothetical protein, partial [Amycolatopsis minnesotensis]|uniref:hypothetical protein n=1 Tax=Amycolatopsis minnesotensis TaxID=337894 RepID=UPI0031D8A281
MDEWVGRFGAVGRLMADGGVRYRAVAGVVAELRRRGAARGEVEGVVKRILRDVGALRAEFAGSVDRVSARRSDGTVLVGAGQVVAASDALDSLYRRDPGVLEPGERAGAREAWQRFDRAVREVDRIVRETNLEQVVPEAVARLVAHEYLTSRWSTDRLRQHAADLGAVFGTADPAWTLDHREDPPGLRAGAPHPTDTDTDTEADESDVD